VLDPAPEFSPIPHVTAPDPSDRPQAAPRGTLPIERLGACIEVLLCSGFPTQLLVFGALTSAGMRAHTSDGGLSASFVIAMSLIDMVLVIGLAKFFLRAHRESLRDLLVGPRRPAREVLLGLLLTPVAFLVIVVVLGIILAVQPSLHNVTVNPFERMLKTPRDAAVFAFVAMFAGGVREEIQRAFIIKRFDQYLGGGAVGIIVYSAVFGLGHLDQGYAASIAIGCLGAAWGCLYWIRRSAIAPMVSHAAFNLAQLLKLAALSG
jgi:membrane protease YdiL (CAAX protease family)